MDTDLKTPIQQCFCAAALLKINGYPGTPWTLGKYWCKETIVWTFISWKHLFDIWQLWRTFSSLSHHTAFFSLTFVLWNMPTPMTLSMLPNQTNSWQFQDSLELKIRCFDQLWSVASTKSISHWSSACRPVDLLHRDPAVACPTLLRVVVYHSVRTHLGGGVGVIFFLGGGWSFFLFFQIISLKM